MEDILRRKEFVNMQIDWEQASKHYKDIVNDNNETVCKSHWNNWQTSENLKTTRNQPFGRGSRPWVSVSSTRKVGREQQEAKETRQLPVHQNMTSQMHNPVSLSVEAYLNQDIT